MRITSDQFHIHITVVTPLDAQKVIQIDIFYIGFRGAARNAHPIFHSQIGPFLAIDRGT